MSDPEPRPTDLRPTEFEAPRENPFANDRLNRKESVESLCSIIQNAQQPLVVSVEGAYGTGKSAYLRMCAAHMERLGALTVEFNAWQQGHTGRPLIDLVAALSTQLAGRGTWDRVKDAAKHAGWRTAGYLTRGIVAPIDADTPAVFEEWIDIDSGIAEFKASLHEQVEATNKKLVIFVDELDRCEPTYALDLLNKARHLFDVEGVAIVFGVNRGELGHAVETLYGPECDVDGYLRRFVDLSMQLRQPTTDEWVDYITGICRSLADSSEIFQNSGNFVRQLLTLLADNCGGRLRDIEQIVRHANLALPRSDYRDRWPLWIICMLTLRYVDRARYDRFVAGTSNVWNVLVTLRDHMPRSTAMRDLAFVDALVLNLARAGEVSHDRDEFVTQYLAARVDEEAAGAAFEELSGRFGFTGDRYDVPIERVHKTIEIAAPI